MKTVLHLFLKDVRQMRRLLVLWLALLATQLASCLAEKQTTIADWDFLLAEGPKLPIWTLLHWIGLVGLVFEVLLADRAFGPEPCWKTRPIARWQMATAKFAFIALFTVLLPGVCEVFVFTGQGVPVARVGEDVAGGVLGQAFVVGLMATCATACRRSKLTLAFLGPLSIGAPFLLVGMTFGIIEPLTKFGLAIEDWDEPPYFSHPPVISFGESFGIPLAMLLGFGLFWLAYLRPDPRRWFAGVALTLSLPALLMLANITAHNFGILEPWIPPNVRPTTTNTMSAAALDLRLEWDQTKTSLQSIWLKPTWTVPLLTDPTNHMVVVLPGGCWARLACAGPLPRQRHDYWARSTGDMPPLTYLNRTLVHSNGPLAVLLGPSATLVSPAELGVTPNEFMPWHDEFKFTRWPSHQLSFVMGAHESEVRIAHRALVRDLPEGLGARAGQLPSVAHTESGGLVISTAWAFGELGHQEEDWVPRRPVLWHPQRRELRLPQSSAEASSTTRSGVLALGGMGQVRTEQHRSTFPRPATLTAGEDRAWLAEAELLLLAFKPVGYRHHVIEVPDVKLPPVEVEP